MPETTALGAAMAAGAAEGVEVWSLKEEDLTSITTDTFTPSITETGTETSVSHIVPRRFSQIVVMCGVVIV